MSLVHDLHGAAFIDLAGGSTAVETSSSWHTGWVLLSGGFVMVLPRLTPLTPGELSALLQAPHLHVPRLVVSRDINGTAILDRLADRVSAIVGSMWTFVFVTTAIVVWLFAGNIVGFDRTPWPLLLVILNLPQLSIMISLQVSANRAQAASDARAVASYETLVALHELDKRELRLLEGQSKLLASQEEALTLIRGVVAGGSAGGGAAAGGSPVGGTPAA